MPECRPLESFWERCKRALRAVDPTVEVERLPADAIETLAPVMLGDAAWDLLRSLGITSWGELVGAVEDRFGVCSVAQKRQFRALKQEPGENGYQFVRRIEDARRKMNKSCTETMDLYFDKLP